MHSRRTKEFERIYRRKSESSNENLYEDCESSTKSSKKQRQDLRIIPQTISSDIDMLDKEQKAIESLTNQEIQIKSLGEEIKSSKTHFSRQTSLGRGHKMLIEDVISNEKNETARTRAIQKRIDYEIAKSQILEQQIQEQGKKLTDLNEHIILLKSFLERHHGRFQTIVEAVEILPRDRHFPSFYNAYRDVALDYNQTAQEEDIIYQRKPSIDTTPHPATES